MAKTRDEIFQDENEIVKSRQTKDTPSGRFQILIRSYKTGNGGWNYSRGTIFDKDGKEVCDIKRNYPGFHHSFFSKGGEEWLVSGEHYLSQVFVNLDTGKTYKSDVSGPNSLCWVDVYLAQDEQTLVVCACVWGGEYGYHFFDFSNPESGWPEIPCKKHILSDYSFKNQEPEFNDDGTISFFENESFYKPLQKWDCDIRMKDLEGNELEYDKDENWDNLLQEKTTVKIEDGKVIVVEEWMSERRIEQKRKIEEYLEKIRKKREKKELKE